VRCARAGFGNRRYPYCHSPPNSEHICPSTCASLQDGKKPRAQAGDFEKQVDQIRKDIETVRANLAAAERYVKQPEKQLMKLHRP
jgi:hypothetical protein